MTSLVAMFNGRSRGVQRRCSTATTAPIVKLHTSAPKHLYRCMEKMCFKTGGRRYQAEGICDIVRCIIEVPTCRLMTEALEALLAWPAVRVVRVKDRVNHVTSSNWMDIMVNLVLVGDASVHVCEVQIVHDKMMLARSGLGGHGPYAKMRAASEILEVRADGEWDARGAGTAMGTAAVGGARSVGSAAWGVVRRLFVLGGLQQAARVAPVAAAVSKRKGGQQNHHKTLRATAHAIGTVAASLAEERRAAAAHAAAGSAEGGAAGQQEQEQRDDAVARVEVWLTRPAAGGGGLGLSLGEHHGALASGARLLQLGEEVLTVVVAGLKAGQPAAASGLLHVGDVLMAVDGRGVRGLPLEKVLARMAGAPGTALSLTLLRATAAAAGAPMNAPVQAAAAAAAAAAADAPTDVLVQAAMEVPPPAQQLAPLLGGALERQKRTTPCLLPLRLKISDL